MTTTRQSAPRAHREPWKSVNARLERERAQLLAELELTAAEAPDEPTATTGSGETEHINSGIEQGVQAALDARTAVRLAEIEDALRRLTRARTDCASAVVRRSQRRDSRRSRTFASACRVRSVMTRNFEVGRPDDLAARRPPANVGSR